MIDMTADIGQQIEQLAAEVQCDGIFRNRPCSHDAKYVVAVHVIDQCRSSKQYTKAGEFVRVLCADCTSYTMRAVARRFEELCELMTPGFAPSCEVCSKPFHRLGDLVTVEHV